MHAFLVDGSFLMRTILSGILVELGFEVSADKDGTAALNRMDEGLQADLLVLDLDSLTESSLTLLYRLRQQRGTHILLISQQGGPNLVRRARLLGADAWLQRPVDRATLGAALAGMGLCQNEALPHAVGC